MHNYLFYMSILTQLKFCISFNGFICTLYVTLYTKNTFRYVNTKFYVGNIINLLAVELFF